MRKHVNTSTTEVQLHVSKDGTWAECKWIRGSTVCNIPDKEGVYLARMRGTHVSQKRQRFLSYQVVISYRAGIADPIAIRPKLSVNMGKAVLLSTKVE